MMRQSRVSLVGFYMKYKRNTGVYDEDHVNDFDARSYTPARLMMEWYAKMERLVTMREVTYRNLMQSQYQQNGLHFSGKGAFERELERKGIPVDKYPLTTTTGATRVREMVVVRRQALEAKSTAAMDKQRNDKRRATPSSWYDETMGPLNPRFLAAMQPHYSVSIKDLPRTPISYAEFSSSTQRVAEGRSE